MANCAFAKRFRRKQVSISVASIILLLATTALFSQDIRLGSKFQSTEETTSVRRYLGDITVDGFRQYVLLNEDQNQSLYCVNFSLPEAHREPIGNLEARDLQVWLLTTNGTTLPPLGGGVSWSSSGGSSNASARATFGFKRSDPMEQVFGAVLKIGKTIHVLRIPPRVGSLSARAQFLFDTLTNYSPEEAEAFESGSLKKKKDAKSSDIKLGIVSAKAQLKELGVNVKWDAGKKTYVLNE